MEAGQHLKSPLLMCATATSWWPNSESIFDGVMMVEESLGFLGMWELLWWLFSWMVVGDIEIGD